MTHRIKKGLSQQQLADELFCSKALIGKIEVNKRAVNEEFITPLSTILEFNFIQYRRNFHKYNTIEHYNLAHELTDLFKSHHYEQLEMILKENSLTKELNYGSAYIIREYCKALVLVNVHSDYLSAEKILLKVLKIKNMNEIKHFSPTFSVEERYFSCIALLSVVLAKRNELENSKLLIENTIFFLEQHFFNNTTHRSAIEQYYKHLYIVLLNNQADILYNQQKYSEAILICHKIQEVMIFLESHFILELVLKLKIQILYKQNLVSLAQKTYEEFVILCRLKKKNDYFTSTNETFRKELPLIEISKLN